MLKPQRPFGQFKQNSKPQNEDSFCLVKPLIYFFTGHPGILWFIKPHQLAKKTINAETCNSPSSLYKLQTFSLRYQTGGIELCRVEVTLRERKGVKHK